jgi:DNA-binding CsgD family transcriptional regulator
MELSPTDAHLKALNSIDLFRTDQKYEYKLSDILRKRQRPLLMLIDRDARLLYSSVAPVAGDTASSPVFTQRLVDEALVEAQRLFKQPQPVASVVSQLIVNKPGERCAIIVLGNELFCLRLFALQDAQGERGELYAALVEPISKPRADDAGLQKMKGLFRLSKREMDVLDALVCGDTDKEIAAKLDVSVETVRAYLKSIRAKLGARTRTAIVSIIHGLQNDKSNSEQK